MRVLSFCEKALQLAATSPCRMYSMANGAFSRSHRDSYVWSATSARLGRFDSFLGTFRALTGRDCIHRKMPSQASRDCAKESAGTTATSDDSGFVGETTSSKRSE